MTKGTNIQMWNCADGGQHPNMQFTVGPVPTSIRWATHPNKCLDVSGGENRDKTNIQLWDCTEDDVHENMQFLMPASGNGLIRWAKHPTKCLDVSGGSTSDGANLQIWSCIEDHPNMQFTLPAGEGPIRWSTHKERCIDVSVGGTTKGTNIQMWNCVDGGQHRNMQFIVGPAPTSIRGPDKTSIGWATHPNKCLDVSAGENRDGTNIQLWDCTKDGVHENMQFLMPASGNGLIRWAKHPTKCHDSHRGTWLDAS